MLLVLVPRRATAAMQTTAMSATIRPYSTIVAPSSSEANFLAAARNLAMNLFPFPGTAGRTAHSHRSMTFDGFGDIAFGSPIPRRVLRQEHNAGAIPTPCPAVKENLADDLTSPDWRPKFNSQEGLPAFPFPGKF